MAGDITEVGASYSSSVGLVFIFNLIVGTGALTMPSAFHNAGWLLSLILVLVLGFTSFLTVTFVIESMAAANAILKARRIQRRTSDDSSEEDNDERPLLYGSVQYTRSYHGNHSTDIHKMDLFDISERVEMGQMAALFFNKIGLNLFYLCIIIYLYGDLAIYAAAVPKSVMDAACTYTGVVNGTGCNVSLTMDDPCWPSVQIDRGNIYRVFVAAFCLLVGPFVFSNVQKTKYLQIFTTVMRWAAFIIMIVLAVIRLAKGKGQGHPPIVDFGGVPNLFGVCVYSFMCHHSLPSLVTPIANKSKLTNLFLGDFLLIGGFYCLLSFTGIYAFKDVNDLYTLNFSPNKCGTSEDAITNLVFIEYFLILFPVFTLSTNFPIIAITLRNNLKAIGYREDRSYPFIVDRVVFPLLALVPPIGIALATSDLGNLVGITGSYAGAGIQYVIPALLVFYARKDTHNLFSHSIRNKHRSLFKHNIWILLVIAWAAVAIILVTVNHIMTGK
ncbi:transmembrane protein 104-like isoform X2 [Tubulanus polymorphus]|uniref:transmembrane protein 104-like isoform X2 n=1 Tax=Tubulanus polymorphus TaxID=672921 RepID=UPI003DA1D0E2